MLNLEKLKTFVEGKTEKMNLISKEIVALEKYVQTIPQTFGRYEANFFTLYVDNETKRLICEYMGVSRPLIEHKFEIRELVHEHLNEFIEFLVSHFKKQ